MAKFTKLIKDGSGGTSDRDYCLVMCDISCGGSGKVPTVDIVYRADENSSGLGMTFVPNGKFMDLCVFRKIPKGQQFKFSVGSSAEAFGSFKSEKLGFNITTLGTETEWFEANEDIDDIKIQAITDGTSGGGSN